MNPIAVGAKIPDGKLFYLDEAGEIQNVSVHSLAAGKKIVIFGVPGAFTPVCSRQHVPGFVQSALALKAKGIDDIFCLSVNDPFVMKEWADSYPGNNDVKFLSDGSGNYTHSLGLELDLTEKGLGIRSQRYSLICDNLEVVIANLEEGTSHMTTYKVSTAENTLKATGDPNPVQATSDLSPVQKIGNLSPVQTPSKERRMWIDRVLSKSCCMCS